MITELFQVLKTNLKNQKIYALNDSFHLGEEYTNQLDMPPRIVIYPTTENYDVPSKREPVTAKTTLAPKKIEKHLYRRMVTMDAAIWGCDYDAVELELLPAFLEALDTATTSTVVLGQGRWVSSVDGGQWLENGRLLIVPFSVPVTVKAKDLTLALVTDVINTGFLEPKPEQDI